MAGGILKDPWAARDDYIKIVLDRSPDQINAYLEQHASRSLSEQDQTKLLQLMELQRHCMLMYTSCGWFFDELSGIETVQVIEYAGRAIQLAFDLFGTDYETDFLIKLELAKSNVPEHQDGKAIYEKWVKPHILDLKKVGAHYAISSLFEEYTGTTAINAYSANQNQFQILQAGRTKVATGLAKVRSEITHEHEDISFGVIYLGDHNINCGIGPSMDESTYEAYAAKLLELFKGADFPEIIRALDDQFGSSPYSLTSLFTDEQRKVMQVLLTPAMEQAEALNSQLYELHAALMLFMRQANIPVPAPLAMAAEHVLNARLKRAFAEENLDPMVIEPLLEESKLAGVRIDETTLEYQLRLNLEARARDLIEKPHQIWVMEDLDKSLTLVQKLPFQVDSWKLQNMAWELLQNVYPDAQKAAERQNEHARQWIDLFKRLAEKLWIELPE